MKLIKVFSIIVFENYQLQQAGSSKDTGLNYILSQHQEMFLIEAGIQAAMFSFEPVSRALTQCRV